MDTTSTLAPRVAPAGATGETTPGVMGILQGEHSLQPETVLYEVVCGRPIGRTFHFYLEKPHFPPARWDDPHGTWVETTTVEIALSEYGQYITKEKGRPDPLVIEAYPPEMLRARRDK